jgi:type IV pilus assembly protein PilB
LVDAGLLSAAQLERALAEQSAEGGGSRRLGQLIVSLGFVSEAQLARVLSQQLAVPWVSLSHIDFSPSLLSLVERELAERYCVIPVYIRRERRDVDTLFLAMDDPTQDDVLRVVSERTRMPVRPMIAPPSDIREAIARAYGPSTDFDDEPGSGLFPMPLLKRPTAPASAPPGPPPRPTPFPRASPSLPSVTPDHPISRPPPPPKPTSAPPAKPDPETTPTDPPPPPPEPSASPAAAAPPAAPATSASAESPPAPASPPAAAMPLSLTLLDGTTIQLPAKRTRARTRHVMPEDSAPAGGASVANDHARDAQTLLAFMRATTRDLSPEAKAQRWEGVVLALVTALLRKGVITERELLDAL